MAGNLKQLNDALFRELERIEACETDDEIEAEARRAREVSRLAGNIIDNANTAVRAAQLGVGLAENVAVRNMLLEAPAEEER